MGNLTDHDKMVLKRSGFVPLEIDQLDNAKTVDGKPQVVNLNTEMWKKTLNDREKHMKRYLKGGKYDNYVAFMTRLRGKQSDTVFDFLKAEYARYLPQGQTQIPSNAQAARVVKRVYKGWWWKA